MITTLKVEASFFVLEHPIKCKAFTKKLITTAPKIEDFFNL